MDLIIGVLILGVLALILSRWKLARVVFVESLSHPLRRTVIKVKPPKHNDAEVPKNEKRKSPHHVVVNH
jgi:hypothetical protein